MKTQAQILAEVVDYNRQLTLSYYKLLKDTDMLKEYVVENGVRLNSAYWILGHLAVTENYLLLKSTGGEIVRFAWAKPFGLGGALPIEGERPQLDEILQTMEQVHTKALAHILTLTDDQLAQPNAGGMKFGNGSVADVIKHAACHEANHAGHLSWICKMNGIKTI